MIKNGKSQMTHLDVPEQLRCLWRHLRLLIQQNFGQGTLTNERKLLVNALDGCIHESTINIKIADKKTYNNSKIQQPN